MEYKCPNCDAAYDVEVLWVDASFECENCKKIVQLGYSSRNSSDLTVSPKAIILKIKDFLTAYEHGASIINELIQNAEDAEAKRFDLVHVTDYGNIKVPSSFRGSCLIVFNNGDFKPEHLENIYCLNEGNKLTDERAIARFGLGLKSVFLWCDAFFVVAKSQTELGWSSPNIVELCNPWSNFCHREWKDDFLTHRNEIHDWCSKWLPNDYGENRQWLALVLPLRRDDGFFHTNMHAATPGDEQAFQNNLVKQYEEIAPSLATLRNLEKLTLSAVKGGTNKIEIVTINKLEHVISCWTQHNQDRLEYQLNSKRFIVRNANVLKNNPHWPITPTLDENGHAINEPYRMMPEVMACISSREAQNGQLRVLWSVAFPTSIQPEDEIIDLRTLPCDIRLILHGNFFLDSRRTSIDGLTGSFVSEENSQQHIRHRWNSILVKDKDGLIQTLPELFNDYSSGKQCLFPSAAKAELADGIRKTWTWEKFSNCICAKHSWRPVWIAGDVRWELLPSDVRVLRIPDIGEAGDSISTCIPKLHTFSKKDGVRLTQNSDFYKGLHCKEADHWREDEVADLLADINDKHEHWRGCVEWFNQFLALLASENEGRLPEAICDATSNLSIAEVCHSKSNKRLLKSPNDCVNFLREQRLFADDEQHHKWIDLLANFGVEVFSVTNGHNIFADRGIPFPAVCDANATVLIKSGTFL